MDRFSNVSLNLTRTSGSFSLEPIILAKPFYQLVQQVTYRSGLGSNIVVDRHVDRKICIADLFAKEIRPFSVRVVLRDKVIVFGDSLVLEVFGSFTKIGCPSGLLVISVWTKPTFECLRTLHSM